MHEPTPTASRPPTDDADLAHWLANMASHGCTADEVSAATGLAPDAAAAAMDRLGVSAGIASRPGPGEPILTLPYPGGRHPRTGFLEGAVAPQRETKVSVFAPWDEGGYVVADVPEAIWSNLGLIYLAHTHVPTVWEQAGVALPPLEWTRHDDGTLVMERALPNGIGFGTRVAATPTDVRFDLWLLNGTQDLLTDLRVQVCLMLARATGFAAQTNANKVFRPPSAAARSDDGARWVVTRFEPMDRCWGNEQCPCLHSDPRFPDCQPGATVCVVGRVWFFEGDDVSAELGRAGQP